MTRGLVSGMSICAWAIVAQAQVTFFTDFGPQQYSGGKGCSVTEVADGYLVFSQELVLDSVGELRTHLMVRKIDLNGQYQWENEINQGVERDYNLTGWGVDPVCATMDGNYASGITNFDHATVLYDGKVELYRFDANGDTLSTKTLLAFPATDSVLIAAQQTIQTADSGFAIAGWEHRVPAPPTVGTLLRTDQHGDTLWYKKYPGTTYAFGIAENFDEGFLLTGIKLGQNWNGYFLIRTDSLGNELWRRWYGGHPEANQQVHLASDGNIVTWAPHSTIWAPDAFDTLACRLTKWDQQGTVIDQGEYRMPYRPFTSDFEELPDGSWITMGKWGEMYRFNKFSASLDTVWTRTYWFFGGFHNLFDVEPTSDGGFIATGEAKQTGANNDPIPGLQTVTVLKLDSMGCLVPGCHTVGVQEIVLGLKDALRVWPNPASDHVNVQVSLPSGFEVQGRLVLVLQDALGREVLRSPLPGSGGRGPSPFSFQLSALPSGLYHLHLLDDTRVLTGTKLVKE